MARSLHSHPARSNGKVVPSLSFEGTLAPGSPCPVPSSTREPLRPAAVPSTPLSFLCCPTPPAPCGTDGPALQVSLPPIPSLPCAAHHVLLLRHGGAGTGWRRGGGLLKWTVGGASARGGLSLLGGSGSRPAGNMAGCEARRGVRGATLMYWAPCRVFVSKRPREALLAQLDGGGN